MYHSGYHILKLVEKVITIVVVVVVVVVDKDLLILVSDELRQPCLLIYTLSFILICVYNIIAQLKAQELFVE